MPYQTQIKAELELQGFTEKLGSLVLWDGWETYGDEYFYPEGSTNHHTVGAPAPAVYPSGFVIQNGRPDLDGPLANCGLDRELRCHLHAAGRANHAGEGGYAGLTGNSSVWGLEVEHVGYGYQEPVTQERWEAMARIHAAFARASGFTAATVHQHFEWAPARKIDFCKDITDTQQFRLLVAHFIMHPGGQTELPDLTDAQVKRLMSAVDLILDGAPKYGVPPLMPTIARIDRSLGGTDIEGEPKPIRSLINEEGSQTRDLVKDARVALAEKMDRKNEKVLAALDKSSAKIAKAIVAELPDTLPDGSADEVGKAVEKAMLKILAGGLVPVTADDG